MTLDEARGYFEGHIAALDRMVAAGDPWVFLCGTVVRDYLASAALGKKAGRQGYKQFIRDFMPPGYKNFRYASGDDDLDIQIYHVLRCGIVHSFSLIPETEARSEGGRNRSIVLTHDESHLSNYTKGGLDACCLRADQFVKDIQAAMNKLFGDAKTIPALAKNVEDRLRDHPPIKGL